MPFDKATFKGLQKAFPNTTNLVSGINPLGPAKKWSSRIGRMYEINAYPCTPTPEIWVKALWTALPTLLLTPIKPSAVDYMIIRIGLGHGTKRRKIFDVWDFEQLQQVQKTGVSWVVFKLAGLGARALWYIAIADAITGFGVNWESAIYQYMGCQFPGEAFAQAGAPAGFTMTGPVTWLNFGQWEMKDYHIFGVSNVYINTEAGYDPTVMFSLMTEPSSILTGPFDPKYAHPALRLVELESGKVIETSDGLSDGKTGGSTHVHVDQTFTGTGAKAFAVQFAMGYNSAVITAGSFSAFGRQGKDNIHPDP